MPSANQRTGSLAERLVASRLEREGFTVRARNVRFGKYEIDLIAQRGGLLVVVEVRARHSDRWGMPWETVDHHKMTRTRRATARWLASERARCTLGYVRYVRFDVASVLLGPEPRIDYYENVGGF